MTGDGRRWFSDNGQLVRPNAIDPRFGPARMRSGPDCGSRRGGQEEIGMRDEYLKGVLSSEKKNLESSEIAARDEFNRQHPPITGLVVEDDLRKMELPARPWRLGC